jgi:hypothetical protein
MYELFDAGEVFICVIKGIPIWFMCILITSCLHYMGRALTVDMLIYSRSSFLWNSKVHQPFHKSQNFDPIPNQLNLVHNYNRFNKVCLNIILRSSPRSPKRSLSLWFFNLLYIYLWDKLQI